VEEILGLSVGVMLLSAETGGVNPADYLLVVLSQLLHRSATRHRDQVFDDGKGEAQTGLATMSAYAP
jgi:hypothetical protein